MTIKSILCIFEGSQEELGAVNAAFLLAKTFRANIRFLHISQSPSNYIGVYEDGIVIRQELILSIDEENRIRMDKAKELVRLLADRHLVPLDIKEYVNHHASAHFIHHSGDPDIIIGKEGIASDIIVLGSSIKDGNIMAALFNTGRPVLLLPQIDGIAPHELQDKVISISWDSSMEAARAIFNAMPILKKAEKIHLLTACKSGKIDENLNAYNPIIKYLFEHGLKPDHIIIDPENHTVAETILNKAKELKSNLLVMGAYSHSRFREIILGSFTRDMLEKSDIPLLLSH